MPAIWRETTLARKQKALIHRPTLRAVEKTPRKIDKRPPIKPSARRSR